MGRIAAGKALALAGALLLASCDPGTRVEGTIRLEDSELEAPDEERHTLYVAAFASGDVARVLAGTSAAPIFVEFGGIENDDFDPDVEYALGGAGGAEEMHVFVWWKIGSGEQPDYEPPVTGDRFGAHPTNPIFEGTTGDQSETDHGVEVIIDRTFNVSTSG